jgi:hypothetical protein
MRHSFPTDALPIANYGGPADPEKNDRGSVWRLVPADRVPAGAVTAPLE